MDEKSFYVSLAFLNESFTLNEIEELGKLPFQQLYPRKTQICSVLNLENASVFGL